MAAPKCTPMPVKDPAAVKSKSMPPKIRKDKAMPIKGKGR